jgi:hypothetical protein
MLCPTKNKPVLAFLQAVPLHPGHSMKKFFTRLSLFAGVSCFLLFLQGCSSQRLVTAWKTEHIFPINYSRILVVAILPDEDSSVRQKVEQHFTETLNQTGYQSSSALVQFGAKGLANLGEELTYSKLCDSGIDAVIIVALINKENERGNEVANTRTFPSNFYFRRIWEYKNSLVLPGNEHTADKTYFWESLLFDLSRLEAVCTIQTHTANRTAQLRAGELLAKPVVQRMIREETLKKQKRGF